MARRVYINGKPAYMANRQHVGRMLINPDAEPLDEVWRFLRACVDVWLSKMRIYSYSKELMEDLETDAMCESYRYLVSRVADGTYRLDLPFYLNCRSAAWTGCKSAADKYYARQKREEGLCSIYDKISDTEIRLVDTLVEHNKLMTESDYKALYKERGKGYKKSTRKDALERQRLEDYFRYVEECVELGVSELSFEQFSTREQPNQLPTQEPQIQ